MSDHPEKKSIHHSFDIDLATIYGVEEAIIIHHFQHWISINMRRKMNFREGRTWSYQTIEEIADHFPYWNLEQVREIVDRLAFGKNRKSKKDSKDFEPVLMKGNFNKAPFDRTTWYAFRNESDFLNISYERGNPQIEEGISPNPIGEIPRPIPDTKTDTKTDCSVPAGSQALKRPENFEKKTSSKESLNVSESQVFSYALKKHPDWTTEEIEEALDALWQCKSPVNSLEGFLEGTIKKKRNKQSFEKMEKAKCQKNLTSPNPKTGLPKEEKKSPMKSSAEYADSDTIKRLFPDL